jgi:histidine triad (HIT) family protein
MKTATNCILCDIANHAVNAAILFENERIMAILDLYPATRGHTLVIPKKHISTIYDMPSETGQEIMDCAILLCKAINSRFKPDGLNLIQANGEVGGQTIDHFHLHIVPRYKNDEVVLKFGHGNVAADRHEIDQVAEMIRQAL